MTPVAIIIGVAVAARVVIIAGAETQAATEPPVVEVAAPGKPVTRKAAAESPTSTSKMATAKAATHMAATHMAATYMAATYMAATYMAATAESAADMSASTETAGVSTPETAGMSTPATMSTPASAAVRSKRVSGQSPGESGSRQQHDHGLAQHGDTPSDATAPIRLKTQRGALH
jgi:hypothetical protein